MSIRVFRISFLFVLFFILAGCNQADVPQKFTSPSEQVLAKSYIDLLRQKRFDDIEKAVDPSIAGPTLHDSLAKMAEFIPSGEPSVITLVGAHRNVTGASSTINLTFEYGFSGKWVLMSVAFKQQGGRATIVGLSVVSQPASLAEQTRFSLAGKSPLQYLIFTLAILFPLFSIWTVIVCVRSKLKGRKWPWVLFILFGFGRLAVNWATGEWSFAPLSFQLLSAGATAPLYGEWTISVSLPIGAIIFFVLRKRLSVEKIES